MVVDGESVLDTKLRMANIELINTLGVSKENLTACLECHCPGAAFQCVLKLSPVRKLLGLVAGKLRQVHVQLRHTCGGAPACQDWCNGGWRMCAVFVAKKLRPSGRLGCALIQFCCLQTTPTVAASCAVRRARALRMRRLSLWTTLSSTM